MPCRGCLNRREFLAIAGAGAALASLAGCGDNQIGAPLPAHIEIVVGSFAGLATIGQLVKVGDTHAAKRTGATTFDAYSMRCTHAGCITNIIAQQFNCPCHGSLFANDGSVIQGPASSSLPKLSTSYNPGTDTLTIN